MKKKNQKWKPQNRVNRKLSDDTQKGSMIDESIQKMEHRLSKTTGENYKVIRDASLPSMSDALLDFADPIMNVIDINDKAAYEKAIQMSIVFWNVSTMIEMNKTSRKGVIKRLFGVLKVRKLLKPFMRDTESSEISLFMLGRKHQLYPDINRFIIDYEIKDTRDRYHLTVVSTVQASSLKSNGEREGF